MVRYCILQFAILFAVTFAFTLCNFTTTLYPQAPVLLASDSDFGNDYTENIDGIDLTKVKVPSLDDDFDEEKINVVLKHQYSIGGYEDYVFAQMTNVIGEPLKSINGWISLDDIENNKLWNKAAFMQILVIEIEPNGKETVLSFVNALNELNIVLIAEPNYQYEAQDLYDPNYSSQWGLHSGNGINAPNAWAITTGYTGVRVGLFETGAQKDHPDLSGRFLQENFTTGSTDHGTHVAGIIGAISGNGQGIEGIAQVTMLLLDSSNFVNSIVHAVNNNVTIINASFRFTMSSSNDANAPYNATHAAAIVNYKGLLVCAAGNDNNNNDTNPTYPASYRTHNIISVGAIDSNGNVSNWNGFNNLWGLIGGNSKSNYGAATVDIFAPGTDIYSTLPNNSYGSKSGTSMAAPFVTGVAALIQSKYPYLQGAGIREAILDNADKPYALRNKCVSHGILNAYRALKNAAVYTVSGDYNGDGKDDIAKFVDKGNNSIALQLWTSTGSSFSYQGEVWYSTAYACSAIAYRAVSGDFNGDGLDDIAAFYDYSYLGNDDIRIHIWLSTGMGFSYPGHGGWWTATQYIASRISGRVVSGDYNGDGKDDIAALYEYNNDVTRCHVWLSTGSSFTYQGNNGWWSASQYRASRISNRVVSGDLNADGKDDIAMFYDYADGISRIHILISTGSSLTYQGNNGWWTPNYYAAPNISTRFVCGDYNGDGKDDLAAFYDYNSTTANMLKIHIWLSTGTGLTYQGDNGWWTPSSYYANCLNGRVVSGDYDGDGKDDIAGFYDYGNNELRLHTWLSTGSSLTYQGDNGWWNSTYFPV